MSMTTVPTLLSADDVLSRRHAPSMLALALAAGAVNAGAFVTCERFVTHATGTVTRIGLDVGQWVLLFDYVLVLIAFIAGSMLSVIAMQRRTAKGLPPLPQVPLFGTVAILVVTAAAGAAGLFGVSAGTIEQAGDFAFLVTLALAMGLMNATVASATAVAIRTTHMTGPATDFGVSLASAMFLSGPARDRQLRLAALRGGKILCFALGAALMLPLVKGIGFAAFVAPAAVIAAATLRSFVPAAVSTGAALPQAVAARASHA
jgi:uncharacterized membrane protein YoaK (UPF0700 family)